MKLFRRALATVVLATLAACASVPKASPERDLAAKQFTAPPAGKAALYVFRNESMGGAIKMSLVLDGNMLGDTGPKTFHLVNINPGKHTLVGKAGNDSTVEFTAKAGETIYVWQEVKMGLMQAQNQLSILDEEKGRAGVAECELAEPWSATSQN